MNGLNEIIAMNERSTQQRPGGSRECSVCFTHNGGGEIVSVILHSATMRDTKHIDWGDRFQRNFFLKSLRYHGLTLEKVKSEAYAPRALDGLVEGYWGLAPAPEQKGTPGYEEAEGL